MCYESDLLPTCTLWISHSVSVHYKSELLCNFLYTSELLCKCLLWIRVALCLFVMNQSLYASSLWISPILWIRIPGYHFVVNQSPSLLWFSRSLNFCYESESFCKYLLIRVTLYLFIISQNLCTCMLWIRVILYLYVMNQNPSVSVHYESESHCNCSIGLCSCMLRIRVGLYLFSGSGAVIDEHERGEGVGGEADDGDEVGCDPWGHAAYEPLPVALHYGFEQGFSRAAVAMLLKTLQLVPSQHRSRKLDQPPQHGGLRPPTAPPPPTHSPSTYTHVHIHTLLLLMKFY